jgi:signal transduction histidine kinase/tetratricopeptide (TPR) repeat protein
MPALAPLIPSQDDGSGELLLGRYRVVRVLKDGDAVRTLLANDTKRRVQVVVKAADGPRLLPAARLRFEHEAVVLRRLNSARVAPLIDFGRDRGLICLVTPLIPGVTLQDLLADGPLPVRDTLTIARCLLEALRDAHDGGVLHRDVKPSNIIVGDGPGGDATLVDFGLARTEWLDLTVRDAAAGTVRYMSPEQAGLIDRGADERSDLYSAGAVVFECLAGRPLVPADTLGEALRLHLRPVGPLLAELKVGVPRAVAEVLGRLLAIDPDDRYQSAGAALADVCDIAAALERGEAEPRVVVGARDGRRTLAEPAFVGRQAEMRALARELARTRDARGESRVVLLEAESGGGKTRLLDEFAARAARDGVRVWRGQAVDQAAQRPYEVLTGVAAGVLAAAQADPAFAEAVRARVGDRSDALCAALPDLETVLGPVGGPGDALLGPEVFAENRTIEAIACLLDALGSAGEPAVVLLDDAQWADELSLKLLAYWQQGRDTVRHTLVLVAFRTEEVDPGHPLRRLTDTARVELGPLGIEEIVQLAESMAGPLPAEATEVLIRLCGGVPFMASAILRGLVESGALIREPTGWLADRDALADVRASQRAATFLVRRIGLLPQASRALLSVGAVLGKEFDPELAAELAGEAPATAFAGLEEARRRRIVWIRGERCVFVHDKLRESLLGLLEPEERRRLHRTAAAHLEARHLDRAFELAFHFDAGGEPERALPYAWQAAQRARARNALHAAQVQYEIAERGAAGADPALRLAIVEGLGDVLMLRGLYDAAGEKYAAARDLVTDRLGIARLQGKIGELHFKRGDVRAASESLEDSLRSLGCPVPAGTIGFVSAAGGELLVQLAHTLAPGLFLARRDPAGNEDEFVVIRVLSRLTHAYWFSRGSLPTLWAHLRELNLAERYPPSAELAQVYSEHAPVMTLIPLFGRGRRYGERSLAIRRGLGDVWGEGQSLGFLGAVLYSAGQFEECIERCREAVRLLERTGDRWEVHTARWHIAFSLYRLGDLAAAAGMARAIYQSGSEIGDAQARGIALSAWSKASAGRVPADLVEAELARPVHDGHTSAEVLQAQAVRLLADGDPAGAVAALQRARGIIRAAGLRQEYVAPVRPWLATALRLQAEATPAVLPERRRALRRQARRAARGAVRQALLYRNNLPHALREVGLLASTSSRPERARRLLDRSLAAAERLGMRHEHAQTLHARATIGVERGWPGSAADLVSARAALAALEGAPSAPEVVTPSLVDQFDTVLEAGRAIASALSADAVYAAVREAASTLLRGERCLVLEVQGEQGEPVPVAGHGDGEFSRAVARRALREGRPVLLDERAALDGSESVVLAGLRSALCAPIHVHGRPVACFYAEHRGVGGLFGEDSARLAGFIASIAGAALENAEGYAQVQGLTRTLEDRVAERTAELSDAYGREREMTAQLRRLDQLKTDFMAMVAHDLRTPITVISGFAAALGEHWDDVGEADRRVFAERIAANSRRLSEFIDNLLQFARIESGELGYAAAPFDLGALVRRTAAEQAGVEGDRITAVVPDDLPTVVGDEQRYWQVLTNLFANAAKFSPPGTGIEVTARHTADGMVEVTVRDHGPGIPADQLPKLFQKFARVDGDAALARVPGTGLGLYICRSIVEAQGGRMGVTSVRGDGTAFTFTVPTAAADTGAPAAPAPRPVGEFTTP